MVNIIGKTILMVNSFKGDRNPGDYFRVVNLPWEDPLV